MHSLPRNLYRFILLSLVFFSFLQPNYGHHPVHARSSSGFDSAVGTTIQVTTLEDVVNATDGKCSLREAVIAANNNLPSGITTGECPAGSGSGIDEIRLAAGDYLLTSTTDEDQARYGDLDITQEVTIIGQGTACANPGPKCTRISGGQITRVFEVFSTIRLQLESLEIFHGYQDGLQGAAINSSGALEINNVLFVANASTISGGAIYNTGTARLTNVSFANNTGYNGADIYSTGSLALENVTFLSGQSASLGGCLYNSGYANLNTVHFSFCESNNGGAIYTIGTLVLNKGTFNNNQARNGSGGGIYSYGQTDMVNATFTENYASQYGGGVFASFSGLTATGSLLNSTLVDNTADYSGNSLGAFYGSFYLTNTLFSSAAGMANCSGTISSLGHNLESGNSCGLTQLSDQPSVGDIHLGSLTDTPNSPVSTFPLLVGSPAIDTGNDISCPDDDSRGIARPQDGDGEGTAHCDIGAYEYHIPQISIADTSVNENFTSGPLASFTVSLDGEAPETITVDYMTQTGTAGSEDFEAKSGVLTFAPGEISHSVGVNPIDDTIDEYDETFFLNLSNPTGGAQLADEQAVCTIADDDAAPQLSIQGVSVLEGNQGTSLAILTLTLSSPSEKNITYDYRTVDGTAAAGSDYQAAHDSGSFNSEELSQLKKEISISIFGDEQIESDEQFDVLLENMNNADSGTLDAVVRILNDDIQPSIYLPMIIQ